MTDEKLYMSLSANTIMAKLTNLFQWTRLEISSIVTIHLTLKMTSAPSHPEDHNTNWRLFY